MNTKKLANLIGTIFIIGILVTFLAGDSDLRALFGSLESRQVETLLENLNIGLAFVAFGALAFLLFFLGGRRGE